MEGFEQNPSVKLLLYFLFLMDLLGDEFDKFEYFYFRTPLVDGIGNGMFLFE